jgi:hypothetical protein
MSPYKNSIEFKVVLFSATCPFSSIILSIPEAVTSSFLAEN